MSGYVATTKAERDRMLSDMGLPSAEALFDPIPESIRIEDLPGLPPPLSEADLVRALRSLSERNRPATSLSCFLGAGCYDHYVPAAVSRLLARPEFFTSYTPYQPEISQGTLQAIFEFQTLVSMLTGLPVANASMYDAATAAAEAAALAVRHTDRRAVWVARGVHPAIRGVLAAYARQAGLSVRTLEDDDPLGTRGSPDESLPAAILVQNPDFLGRLHPLRPLADRAHDLGALAAAACDPVSLALVEPPGACGFDIAVGEMQPFGGGLSFGGPQAGYMAVRESLLRRMPGRIVGETVDREGRRCYVLTLQAREQHIRRDKATSNICSNHSLCAVAAAIHLSLLGRQGLSNMAADCARKAARLRRDLLATELFRPEPDRPFFREFALSPGARIREQGGIPGLNRFLLGAGILGGLDAGTLDPALSGLWLLAVTEKRTPEELDALVRHVVRFADMAEGGDAS